MPSQDIEDYLDPQSLLRDWVVGRVSQWRDHRDTNYQKKWDEYYRIWRGIWTPEDKTRDSEKSRLISPASQQAVESTVAELEEATFGRDIWFDIDDDALDQDKTDITAVRTLLKEDLEKENIKTAMSEVFLNGAIYGTGIGKIVVSEKEELIAQQVPIPGTLIETTITKPRKYVCVGVDPISPKEFVIDPTATSIDDALGVAHETIKPRFHIEDGIKAGIYENKVIAGDFTEAKLGFDEEQLGMVNSDDKVKITEYWGKVPKKFLNTEETFDDFDYNEDELVEAVVTIANDSVVLRAKENPYTMKDRPFVSYQHDRVPNKFWGRGVMEKGYNPQKALDAELRARIDGLALTTHPMMGLDATRLPRGAKFEIRPGKTILTNGNPKDVLMPLNFGSMSQNTFTEAAELERMVQMGTGAMDTANSNFANPRNSTASGMSMLQAAAIKRQKRTLLNIQDNFFVPMINKVYSRKKQLDPERYPMQDYKFKPYSTMGIMAKELETTQMIQLMSMVPQNSPAFGVILTAIFENSSMSQREELVAAVEQMNQPDPMQQQMQQLAFAKEMAELEELKADITKTYAEAEKLIAEVRDSQGPQAQADKELKLIEKLKKLDNLQAATENLRSETMRNVPEVQHLNSETILNLAKARMAKQ